jgi:hypothetical protein
MGEIPLITATVERNGAPVDFNSFRITRESQRLAPSWTIDLPSLVNIDADDTWTIKVGICGAEWTRVSECRATAISGTDAKDTSTRTVSCEGDIALLSDLREFCLPKTYCFVNPSWLYQEEPTAFLEDGIIKFGKRSGTVNNTQRYYHYRLPKKEMLDGTFECILGPVTHWAIAKHLANLVGYEVIASTPDIPLVDTMTFESGMKWGDAITSIFSLWGPTISIVTPTNANERPKIMVVDPITENATVAGAKTLKVGNSGIIQTTFSQNIERELIDHIIVTGRASHNSIVYIEQPNYSVVDIPANLLSVDVTVPISTNITGKDTGVSQDYTGFFGIPGTPEYRNPLRAVRQTLTQGYHKRRTSRGYQWILVGETTVFYNAYDVAVGKVVATHYHSPGYKPVKTIEKNYVYTNLPGSSSRAMELVRVKCTYNDQFVVPLKQAFTTEIVYDLVIFYWTRHTDGKEYRVSPAPILDLIGQDYSKTAIPESDTTKADTLWMMTNIRKTEISRTHEDVLLKRDLNYAILSEALKVQSQILENPMKDKTSNQDQPQKWEFFLPGGGKVINGIRCYHSPKTIQHDDVDNYTLAKKIVDRIFYRRGIPSTVELTVNSPVPIPAIPLASIVRVAEFTRLVNGVETTIPEADYVLKSIEESVSVSGKGNDKEFKYSQNLKVKTRF